MKARSKSRQKAGQPVGMPGMGVFGLLLAMMLLGTIAFFMRDYRLVRFELLGSYIWLLALLTAFFAVLTYFAQFILPLRGDKGWYEGLRLLTTYYLNPFPAQLRRRRAKVPPSAPPQAHAPPSFAQVGVGVVDSHLALALAKGPAFTRAAGPGYVRLNRGEHIGDVVDLRPQHRGLAVEALTRDGIPLTTSVSVTFRVKQWPPEAADPAVSYPYDDEAVFRVSYFGSIDAGEALRYWSERVAPQAAADLVAELSRHTLDDLYQLENPNTLDTITTNLKQQLKDTFDANGIEILSVGVGQFDLPDDVREQRINNWQATWQRQIQFQEAAGDAEAYRRIKMARARVQVEMIENITQSIEMMRQAGNTELADIVTLRMLQVMERALANATVRALIPSNLRNTISQLQTLVEQRPTGEEPS